MLNITYISDSKSTEIYPLNVGRCESTLHFGARSSAQQWKEALRDMSDGDLELNSRLLPTSNAVNLIKGLKPGDSITLKDEFIAKLKNIGAESYKTRDVESDLKGEYPLLFTESASDYFTLCDKGIHEDLERLKLAWSARTLSESERESWMLAGVIIHGELNKIHISPGVKLRSCIINTEGGDVVLGPNSEVMEGACIRGPFTLGESSQVRMGALIYGPTSIGKHCKVGGELSNVVFHDYSNKAHGGFLGNSVLGSWCNLGAETTSSNLKNTYGKVKIYSDREKSLVKSELIFCGLLMGDHSKTGIHTAFNTATVVGAFCNVFGPDTPPKHIPSFSWGGSDGLEVYKVEQAISTARKVMARRGLKLSPVIEVEILKLFSDSKEDREK